MGEKTQGKGLELGAVSLFVLLYGVLQTIAGLGHFATTPNPFVLVLVVSGVLAIAGAVLDFVGRGGLGLACWIVALLPVILLVILVAIMGDIYIPLYSEGMQVLRTPVDWFEFLASGLFYALVLGVFIGLVRLRRALKSSN